MTCIIIWQKAFSALRIIRILLLFVLSVLVLSACQSVPAATPTPVSKPAWFDMPLTDAQSGESFKINDFSGKVVLLETMAMWCPNCLVQAAQVRKLHELLGNPDDLISISLDVDVNEDQATLKKYTEQYELNWRFAITPLEVAREIGNLYTAQYLNPPLSPMMVIDREGNVHHLAYGRKDAEFLAKSLAPYLKP